MILFTRCTTEEAVLTGKAGEEWGLITLGCSFRSVISGNSIFPNYCKYVLGQVSHI